MSWQVERLQMSRWQEWAAIIFILGVAACLRLTAVDWDGYEHYHPDERYITWVASTIEWPATAVDALHPTQSSWNPFYWPADAASPGISVPQDERRDFAYGHVPLYAGVLATRLVEKISPALVGWLPADWLLTRDILNGAGMVEFRHLTAVGRALTALFDLGTVFGVYWLGKRLYRPAVGLLAAAFLAVNVMHIQLAHFFTSDPMLTFFVFTAVACLVHAHQQNRPRFLLLAAVFTGLAVGSKFAAILLFLPLALAVWLVCRERWSRWGATAVCVAALTFFVTNPFAVLDFGCQVITPATTVGPVEIPALNWGSCYLQNIVTQGAMVRGSSDIPFTRQYLGTTPYLYFIEMQARWGMGWPLALAAFAGLAWQLLVWGRSLPLRRWWQDHGWRWWQWPTAVDPSLTHGLVWAWVLPFFLSTGSFLVKFMRYLQPITPFLMIYAAALCLSLPSRWGRLAATAVLLPTALYALSFVNMYQQPHPWLAGSAWIFEQVPPNSLILSEQWDDALPSSLFVDGDWQRRAQYRHDELTWLTGADGNDNVAKLEANLARLAAADYVTIVSNRSYGVLPLADGRYPLSGQYHQLLFDGSLGYEAVYVNGRGPRLANWVLVPDYFTGPGLTPPAMVTEAWEPFTAVDGGRVDESFTVYDQPLLIIFKNTGQLSLAQMKQLFVIEAQ